MVTPRKRARQACTVCNARRVKCDVTERMPCRNCEAADILCEVRESRRGKHPRNHNRRSIARSSVGLEDQQPLQLRNAEHVEASQALASLSQPVHQYDRHFAWNGATVVPPPSDTASRDEARQEDDGAVFLGESTSIRYVHEEPEPSPASGVGLEATRFRHSVPNAVKAENLIPEWEAERRRSRIKYLRSEGAFDVPSQEVLDALLGAYFRWFHPCFAVVDQRDVWAQVKKGTLSPLLLQAMLFIGVVHCDEDKLLELGLGVRHRAKYIYYNQAKDIYDADYEPKKLVVVQALFLMSFWRAGALLEKDVRHWLGVAITLALTKALHRAAGGATPKVESLRKRIWWSIYVRERQCAAALGLPNRIRDEDIDIEPLERSDFDNAFDSEVPIHESEECISFHISMTGLARTLGQVVHNGYLPHKQLSSRLISQLKDELIRWKQQLPPAMQSDNDFGNKPGFLVNMLHLAYNNLLILLYRSGYIRSAEENPEVDGGVALQAAARNSRIIEDMLPAGNLRHAQTHVITNLFNTLCIHTLNLQRSSGTARAIAEHRAKICLMGLKELQKTWEVTNWVLQLFFQYLDRSTAARLQMLDETAPTSKQENWSGIPNAPLQASIETLKVDAKMGSGSNDVSISLPVTADTPWSWSTEEANQFLFTQIENDFSFGEGGGILDWNTDDAFGSILNPPDTDPSFLPP